MAATSPLRSGQWTSRMAVLPNGVISRALPLFFVSHARPATLEHSFFSCKTSPRRRYPPSRGNQNGGCHGEQTERQGGGRDRGVQGHRGGDRPATGGRGGGRRRQLRFQQGRGRPR